MLSRIVCRIVITERDFGWLMNSCVARFALIWILSKIDKQENMGKYRAILVSASSYLLSGVVKLSGQIFYS